MRHVPNLEKARTILFLSVIPSPQEIGYEKGDGFEVAHESIRRNEDQSLSLICIIEPSNVVNENQIQWEFSPDGKQYGALPDGATKNGATIQFDSVKKFHRGYYQCKLNNFP